MSSMPEVHTPAKDTIVDPAAVAPTTTASEATKDPIRPAGTDALVPESRPELTNSTEGASTVSTAGAAATEPTGETAPKGASVVESQPINEGILNYKGPGLVKSLIFQKKFFWFNDEPLEHKHLSSYLSNEKPDVSHRNAAHATQTGKGLLFFAKRAEDKNHPAGILNLGEISDFAKGDFNDFSFKLHGHKHTFQAPSRAERDGWLVAIETQSSEAKEAHEGLVGSQGYKSQLEKFAKPTGAAATTGTSRSASRPKKLAESKPVESKPVESKLTESKAGEPRTTETVTGTAATAAAVGGATSNGSSSDEAKPKSKSKSRSQSRKRGSIFGTLLGKKEEHDDKKELKKEEKEEKKEIKKEQKEDKVEHKAEENAIKHDLKKGDKAETKAEKEELKLEQHEASHGASTSGHMDAAAIAARVVGAPLATEGETVPTTAGTTDNITSVAGGTPVTSAVEPATGTTSRETAPRSNKRGSIFGNFFNKKDAASPNATEAAPAVPTKDNETAVTSSTAPQLENPVSSQIAAATTTTTEPSATAKDSVTSPVTSPLSPDTTKPQRRSSFFNNLGTKKERRSEAISDAEGTDGEGRKSTTSKLGGLFRKPSRATPTRTEPTTSGTADVNGTTGAPAPISKEEPATTNGNGNVSESPSNIQSHQTPVQASA